MATIVRIRNAIGQAMRRVGLHRLSGWWDAGTDAMTARRWLADWHHDKGYVQQHPKAHRCTHWMKARP